MKLFHLLGFGIELVFGTSTSVTRLSCFFRYFLDGSHFFKEPEGMVCHAFEEFNRGVILLKLEMIRFLPIIFKLFIRVTKFDHLLLILSSFHPHF